MQSRSATYVLIFALAAVAACEELTTPEKRTIDYQVVVGLNAPASNRDTFGVITTGDILRYGILVLTEDALFLPQSETWASSDPTLLETDSPQAGVFLARAVDSTTLITVSVVAVVELEGQPVTFSGADTLRVLRERFFGEFADTTLQFLQALNVRAPPEQSFTANTQILFEPDAATSRASSVPGIVASRSADSALTVLVPAGFTYGSAPVRLTEIGADGRSVQSRLRLGRALNDRDLDLEEPNDTIAGATSISIPLPLAVLSIHGDADNAIDAQDRDFFTFSLAGQRTLTFTLLWNVPSNLDFEIFHDEPVIGKVTDHSATGTSTSGEQATVTLSPRQYFLRIYPAAFVGPTTYVLVIQQQ